MKSAALFILFIIFSTELFGSDKVIDFTFKESKAEKVVVVWQEMSDMGQSVCSGIIVFEQNPDGIGYRVGIDSDVSMPPFWRMSKGFADLDVELEFYNVNSVDALMWEGALGALRGKDYHYINSVVLGRHFKIDFYRIDVGEELLCESFTVPGYPLFVHEYLMAKVVK